MYILPYLSVFVVLLTAADTTLARKCRDEVIAAAKYAVSPSVVRFDADGRLFELVQPGKHWVPFEWRVVGLTAAYSQIRFAHAVFQEDGSQLAVAMLGGAIDIFDTATGLRNTRLAGEKRGGEVKSLCFDAGGVLLAKLSADGFIEVFDTRSHERIYRGRADGAHTITRVQRGLIEYTTTSQAQHVITF